MYIIYICMYVDKFYRKKKRRFGFQRSGSSVWSFRIGIALLINQSDNLINMPSCAVPAVPRRPFLASLPASIQLASLRH